MRKDFDVFDGRIVSLFTLENNRVKIELCDHGARLISWWDKEKQVDIVQGFDSLEGYLNEVRYMGATVGRVANRIGKGTFQLNGQEYHLPINNKGNTLHGGLSGFDMKIFEAREEKDRVIFHYISKDKEEGFPGNLDITVTYRLLKEGWGYDVEVLSDQDTLCSITNHTFFNLNGQNSDSAMNHLVKIEADEYAHIDQNGLTLPIIEAVQGTPFDFRQFKRVNQDIETSDLQIQWGNGYDHNFLIRGTGLRLAATVIGEASAMEIKTTLPCMHFYSANFLEGTACGKAKAAYPKRSSLCFETQYFPNAIQYDCAQKPILKANKRIKHTTEYRLI